MHKLYDLKEMLCNELENYGGKDEIDEKGLTIVDMLAHTIKNLDKIIESYEDEDYSMGYDSYRGGRGSSYGSYRGGNYSRGRGRNARRDSMGRYSRAEGDFRMQLEELMQDAPNEQVRQKIERMMSEM